MAGASLLTLIDDIASLLDDVAVLSKVAIKKTSGVLGDDLALNAQQVAGGILSHGLPTLHHVATEWTQALQEVPRFGAFLALVAGLAIDAGVGILAGAGCLLGFLGYQKLPLRSA